jgi:hypothetical protein
MLVVVGRDMEAGSVSVRLHHGGPQGAKPKEEVVADILASIKERSAYEFSHSPAIAFCLSVFEAAKNLFQIRASHRPHLCEDTLGRSAWI